MVKVPAAFFEPDKSRYNMAAANDIMNVLPVADGWAPMPSASQLTPAMHILTDEDGKPLIDELGNYLVSLVSGASANGEIYLPEPSKGGIFVRLTNGTTALFVGTGTKLWRYDFTDYYWKDVSGVSAPYSCDTRWSFALYGTTVYCQNGNDSEQMFDLSTDTVFSDNATAPIASYVATVADFLMRGRLSSNEDELQWSALNDPTGNDYLDRFSDSQIFGEGNGIRGIIPVSSGAVVFLRDAVELLSYPDPTYVFRRSSLTQFRGAMAPASICSIGQDDFVFYAVDGFFRGTSMTPIGAERVDRFILSVCDQTARENMISAPDFRRKIVWFQVNSTTEEKILLGYHWQLDRWTISDADLADMFRLETVGMTIGGFINLFETIADIDITFGSSLFDGGSVEFGGVDSSGALVYLYGPSMAATITTNEASFNGPNRAIVNGGRVDGDVANFEAMLSTSDYKGAGFTDRTAVTPSSRTRFIPLRGDGRVHKVQLTIPEGEPWTIFQGVDVDVAGSGKS